MGKCCLSLGVGKVWGIFWLWFDFTSTMRECMGVELGDHEFLSSWVCMGVMEEGRRGGGGGGIYRCLLGTCGLQDRLGCQGII